MFVGKDAFDFNKFNNTSVDECALRDRYLWLLSWAASDKKAQATAFDTIDRRAYSRIALDIITNNGEIGNW